MYVVDTWKKYIDITFIYKVVEKIKTDVEIEMMHMFWNLSHF